MVVSDKYETYYHVMRSVNTKQSIKYKQVDHRVTSQKVLPRRMQVKCILNCVNKKIITIINGVLE